MLAPYLHCMPEKRAVINQYIRKSRRSSTKGKSCLLSGNMVHTKTILPAGGRGWNGERENGGWICTSLGEQCSSGSNWNLQLRSLPTGGEWLGFPFLLEMCS